MKLRTKLSEKIGRKIFLGLPGNSCFIKGELATLEGSYGVFPYHGRVREPSGITPLKSWAP